MAASSLSPILYQNEARDITLIDIPLSIAAAQGISDALLSSTPLIEPFVIANDPKTDAAKAKVGQNTVEDGLHSIYQGVIDKALANIKENISGNWCLPRKIVAKPPRRGKKKEEKGKTKTRGKDKDSNVAPVDNAVVTEASLEQHLKDLQKNTVDDVTAMVASLNMAMATGHLPVPWMVSYQKPQDTNAPESISKPEIIEEEWDWAFHNRYSQTLDITVFKPHHDPSVSVPKLHFKIPSKSTFYLHNCLEPSSFRSAFRSITDDFRLPRHFDFVLLDPPWPNRSAKRKAEYNMPTLANLKHIIHRMDLDLYIEHDALVGIWITNKPVIRDLVLGEDGIFQRLNVGLVEEWIWIKTTTKGEPISAMDSTWRKPYEMLLLGRAAKTSYMAAKAAETVKRRVIAGVPDLHSRKPCLKELVKAFLPEDYSALEIFPRHLVAGWTAWGDQVLKFNWEGYWAGEGVDVEMAD